MAWVSGGALWLAARSTGKIGNEMRAYVCWGCEIVQTCVWIIAQQLCAMQQINVALCQATANISASLVCVSLTVFFFFPLSLLLLLLLGTFNALHTYNCSTWKCQLHIQDPCYIIAYLVVENWFFQRPNLQRELIWGGGRTVRIAGRRLTLPTARKQWRVNHNLRGFLSKDESEFVFSFPSDSHWRVKSEVNN